MLKGSVLGIDQLLWGAEVLEAWKKVENSVVSFAAAGIAIDAEAAGEAGVACSTAQGLISALFPAVLATLSSEDDEVATCLVPFLQSYVAKLKNSLKREALSQVRISEAGRASSWYTHVMLLPPGVLVSCLF